MPQDFNQWIAILLFGITATKELRQFHSRSGITHQSQCLTFGLMVTGLPFLLHHNSLFEKHKRSLTLFTNVYSSDDY